VLLKRLIRFFQGQSFLHLPVTLKDHIANALVLKLLQVETVHILLILTLVPPIPILRTAVLQIQLLQTLPQLICLSHPLPL
jgi:hypothetical protein